MIYLTFDAGYEAGYTEQILDVLKKHDVKAAFFVVGTYIENNPELVRRMAEEGHIVGNHTWHHYNMSQIADLQSFTRELQSVADQYREATGEEMLPYYRPPQGVYSEENLKMAKSLGYRTVFWSLAYVDWNRDAQPTPEQAYEKLLPRIHPGAVVLPALDVRHERGNSGRSAHEVGGHGLPLRDARRAVRRGLVTILAGRHTME